MVSRYCGPTVDQNGRVLKMAATIRSVSGADKPVDERVL